MHAPMKPSHSAVARLIIESSVNGIHQRLKVTAHISRGCQGAAGELASCADNYRSSPGAGNRKMSGLSVRRILLWAVIAWSPCDAIIADEPWVDLLGENHRQLWRGYKAESWPPGWEVADGVLTRTAGGEDLMTVAEYGDFDLRFEWRISEGGNSGVLYRVSTGDEAAYFSGPEYQLLDNKADSVGSTSSTSAGSLYALYAPPEDVTRPVGEWNKGRIVVRGRHVEHWLNGQPVVECELESEDWKGRVAASKFKDWPKFGRNRAGHIALQEHGSPVAFRQVRIRALTEKPPTEKP